MILSITPSQSNDQIDLDEIIGDYKVTNVEAFGSYLKSVWKDLLGRSDQTAKGIDKMTFLKYYELPGMISERLFSVFDTHQNGSLSKEDFVNGMITLFSGDFEKLLTLIFKFYDFNRDGTIDKEDIRRILSYIPLKTKPKSLRLKFEKENFDDRVESQNELHQKLDKIFNNKQKISQEEFKTIIKTDNSDLFLYILIFLLEKRPFNNETIKLLESIKKSPTLGITKSPKQLIASPNLDSKFAPSTTISKSPRYQKGKGLGAELANSKNLLYSISGKKSANNLAQVPSTMSYELKLPGSADDKKKHEDATNGTSQKHPTRKMVKQVKNLDTKIPSEKKYVEEEEEKIGLEYARVFEDPKNTEASSSDDESTTQHKTMEGFLYKLQDNTIKKIYFKLICKDLYYYKSKEDEKHKGMHNLSGVFVKEEDAINYQEKKLYCFSVLFPAKKRQYYCDNLKEYNEWLTALRKAVGYSNLGDLYEIKEVLGKGKFGLVRLGIHKQLQRKVAIKIIKKKCLTLVDLQQVKIEIEILKIAQHPNIIRLYDVFENEEYIYIIMEHCAGGDLFSYLEDRGFKLKEERAAKIIHKLSTAIYFLHEYGIVHRDLKPENILMTDRSDDADIRLLDFGLGKIIGPNETCKDPFGTLSYVAPEILLEEPYNSKVDLWAIGIITYLLLAGFLPFDSDVSEKEIARQTVYEPTPFPSVVWNKVSLEAKMFVENLLNKNPAKRMTIKEVLEHKWLQKFCSKNNDTVLKRRKSRDLSGGEQFKIYATLVDDEKK